MSKFRVCIALGVLFASGLLLYQVLLGGPSIVAEEDLQEIVYVDRETGKTFLIRARNSPEFNPETGEQSLIPGMYCDKCQAWKAVGPIEAIQTRKVRQICPIHKRPLSRDGPLPEEQSS